MRRVLSICVLSSAAFSCAHCNNGDSAGAAGTPGGRDVERFPLVAVADVDLPGKPVRFDYQAVDEARGRLVIAHMNDGAVDVVALADGSVVKRFTGIPTARGVATGGDRIFVTSAPNVLVIIDAASLVEIARVPTGNAPDGVAWDGDHEIVGVSDQRDGAVSLLARGGRGARVQVPVGIETGNVVYDRARHQFWVTAVRNEKPDRLVAIDPVAGTAAKHVDLPGCEGAHGLRLHSDGKSAFVACEANSVVMRVAIEGTDPVATAKAGAAPDVLDVDPGLGLLYVAAENGDLAVFDLTKPGLVSVDAEHIADDAHSVAVDPATHRVFFPLAKGPHGTPVLRIMRPRTP